MVTRVDPKPTYYFSTLFKCIRPAAVVRNAKLIRLITSRTVGVKEPPHAFWTLADSLSDLERDNFAASRIYDDIARDCERGTDPYSNFNCAANFLAKRFTGRHAAAHDARLSEAVSKFLADLTSNVGRIFHGAEAAVALTSRALDLAFVKVDADCPNTFWAMNTAHFATLLQSSACCQHSDALAILLPKLTGHHTRLISGMFSIFATAERVLYRSSTAHTYSAHLHYSGKRCAHFESRGTELMDFEVTIRDKVESNVRIFKCNSLTYVLTGTDLYVLSTDDVVSVCKMLRACFNIAVYFQTRIESGGGTPERAVKAATSLFMHLRMRIEAKRYYADTLRALNIINMRLFNKLDEVNEATGYTERDAALTKEIRALDDDALTLAASFTALAINSYDELNVIYMYHACVGDDAGADDLLDKLKTAQNKPLKKDPKYWADFLRFFDSYSLARFITIHRRIPKTGGADITDRSPWVAKCMMGSFKMPARSEYGNTWIEGEFEWRDHAEFWHLSAQDVTFVVNNPELYAAGGGKIPNDLANELLYTLTRGNILDPITGATPLISRANLAAGVARTATTMVGASKNEASKPSWKKRVTFSADNEFRKTQAGIDKNISTFLSHIPGSVLSLPVRASEKKFKSIAHNTILEGKTLNTSQDVSAWSESQDREGFFEFMFHALRSGTFKEAINVKQWWAVITVMFNKMGTSGRFEMANGGFQGMPGRQDSLEHAAELLFWIDNMRADGTLPKKTKVLHNTCIDDCVASLLSDTDIIDPIRIYAKLEVHYKKLGYELDRVKSIISYIKAVFCSRRFVRGVELPSDFKTFIKHGVSYDSVFHTPTTAITDCMSSALGAVNAGGHALELYVSSLFTGLATVSLYVPELLAINPERAAAYCMLTTEDYGWGVPDIVQWITKDVVDQRTRSNFIFQSAAEAQVLGHAKYGISASAIAVFAAAKNVQWAQVSRQGIFNNPFACRRAGPVRVEEIISHTLRPYILDAVKAEPWKTLFALEKNPDMVQLIDIICTSSTLDATIVAALSGCFPWAFSSSIAAKCYGSSVVISALPGRGKYSLQRRIMAVGKAQMMYLEQCVVNASMTIDVKTLASLNAHDLTMAERDAFYAINGMSMVNHTFPDPLATFTQVADDLGSSVSFEMHGTRVLARDQRNHVDPKVLGCRAGLFVPPKSHNVLEFGNKRILDWDPVTRCIITGMVVLAIATDEGHDVRGLGYLFTSAWDVNSYVDIDSPLLASARGSAKRLSANPGSATHPIFAYRNFAQHIKVDMATAIAALPADGHMHDVLGSITAYRAAAAITAGLAIKLGLTSFDWKIGFREVMCIRRSQIKMRTSHVIPHIAAAINNSSVAWGFAQICPDMAERIAVCTRPNVTAAYMCALTAADKSSYSIQIHAAFTAAEQKDFTYPDTVKPRSAIMYKSAESAQYAAAMLIKGSIASSALKGDAYVASSVGPLLKMVAGAVNTSADDATLAQVIRTALITSLHGVHEDSILAAASSDPEGADAAALALVADRTWEKACLCADSIFGSAQTALIWHNAFARLGATDFSSSAVPTIQTLKSYAGAHISILARAVLPEYLRILGGSSSAYDVTPQMLIIAADADRINDRLRLKALTKARAHSIKDLKTRIKALESSTVTHWADAHILTSGTSPTARLTYLRVRLLAFKSLRFKEDASVNESATVAEISTRLTRVQLSIAKRRHVKIVPFAVTLYTAQDAISAMFSIHEHLTKTIPNHGFVQDAGEAALREAFTWFNADAAREQRTVYAVTPGKFRPASSHIVASNPREVSMYVEPEPPDDTERKKAEERFTGWSGVEDAEITHGNKAPQAAIDVAVSSFTLQKKLLCCFLNGVIATFQIKKYIPACKGIPDTEDVTIYRTADALHLSTEFILSTFGDLELEYASCGELWDESMLTVLDDAVNEGDFTNE